MNLSLMSWHLRKKLGIPTCDGAEGPCHRIGTIRRQNTAYEDNSLNLVRMCPQCFAENEKYWAEQWSDYYGEIDPRGLL